MRKDSAAFCSEAFKNPYCLNVTQININTACMKQVDRALISLLGEDGTRLNGGVIHRMLDKLDDLEAKNKVSSSSRQQLTFKNSMTANEYNLF